MGVSLKPGHVKRYRDVARLLFELRNSGVDTEGAMTPAEEASPAGHRGAGAATEAEVADGDPEKAERLVRHLEEMGPAFVKLGQLLSSRADLVDPVYLKALSRLQEKVEPFPFAEVEAVLSEELGARPSKIFQELDPEPLAAASLGQVHRAVLRDGRLVAVKVLRPGVLESVPRDLEVIEEMVGVVETFSQRSGGHDLSGFLEEFRSTLLSELDYRKEADHLERLRLNLEGMEGLEVPRPILDLSSRRVLTMEYVPGRSVAKLGPLARLDVDTDRVLDILFKAYLKQALVDGFVHADPHPGNVFITEEGNVALLDAGMVLHLTSEIREGCVRILRAMAKNDGEETAKEMEQLGTRGSDFRRDTFRKTIGETVSRFEHRTVFSVQPGKAMLNLARTADEEGLSLPPQFALLAKTLINLDRVAEILDPEFDSERAVRRHLEDLVERRMLSRIPDPRDVAASLVEAGSVIEGLPKRLERVLDTLERNDFRVNVEVAGWEGMIRMLHRSAAHISAGIVLASLIVGASFLMRVETEFQLLGYPGLAIVLFLLAAIGGVALVVYILWGEHHH